MSASLGSPSGSPTRITHIVNKLYHQMHERIRTTNAFLKTSNIKGSSTSFLKNVLDFFDTYRSKNIKV